MCLGLEAGLVGVVTLMTVEMTKGFVLLALGLETPRGRRRAGAVVKKEMLVSRAIRGKGVEALERGSPDVGSASASASISVGRLTGSSSTVSSSSNASRRSARLRGATTLREKEKSVSSIGRRRPAGAPRPQHSPFLGFLGILGFFLTAAVAVDTTGILPICLLIAAMREARASATASGLGEG